MNEDEITVLFAFDRSQKALSQLSKTFLTPVKSKFYCKKNTNSCLKFRKKMLISDSCENIITLYNGKN